MGKQKNHKGLLKRIRITKSGLVRHRSANHKHLRSGKGGKRLRQLRKDPMMSSPEAKRIEKLLFRRLRGRTQPLAALRKSPSPAQRKALKAEKAAAKAGGAAAPAKTGAKKVAKKSAATK
ncbi:MAG TPA: bL35 family ribosomal protein [Phycisphaerales bacterium]